MTAAVVVVTVAAAAAAFIPGEPSRVIGWAVISTVIALPLARVLLLVVVWLREHDHRYASTAVLLLCVIAAGTLIALVQ